MNRRWAVGGLIVVLILGSVAWIASRTTWDEVEIPLPSTGEARTNPFYPVRELARGLGAAAEWRRSLELPPPDGVLVIGAWHWDLLPGRRQAIERWVDSGGRLVVDGIFEGGLGGGLQSFQQWSGISARPLPAPAIEALIRESDDQNNCRALTSPDAAPDGMSRFTVCTGIPVGRLESRQPPRWQLTDVNGIHVLRVSMGRGSVTVLDQRAFHGTGPLLGDHAFLFAAATQLRANDTVIFLSDEERPSLLSLIWSTGAPVVVLFAVLIVFWLWRQLTRFGPTTAPPVPARRSLAEQVRGTGRFVLEHGNGEALHASARRALEETAGRYLPGYRSLTAEARIASLAALVRVDDAVMARAMNPLTYHRHEVRRAIALLERVRRRAGERPAR